MPPFEEVIDTPDKAVETVGAAMDRLRQLAYRVPPDEDGHGAVTWQEKYEQAVGLLAEAGMVLHAIQAKDGAPYHAYRDYEPKMRYMEPMAFDNLVERISEALGGNIPEAAWAVYEQAKAAKGDGDA